MSTHPMMSYPELEKLRFLDFFPKQAAYQLEENGAIEYCVGYGYREGYEETYFVSRKRDWKTAEIHLQFQADCPMEEGVKMLDCLKLEVRPGHSIQQVKDLLGHPELDRAEHFLRFIFGADDLYYVGCIFSPGLGLAEVWIARKDLVDQHAAI